MTDTSTNRTQNDPTAVLSQRAPAGASPYSGEASASPAAQPVKPPAAGSERGTGSTGRGFRWTADLRFMIVVLAAIVVLFLAFALLIAFNPNGAAISALAIIAAPIATMVAAYYGIALALRQVRDARVAAEAADSRARAAERTARESDAWAAQMESGLRVAVAKLRAARVETIDVERAAGTPDDFF